MLNEVIRLISPKKIVKKKIKKKIAVKPVKEFRLYHFKYNKGE